MQGGVYFNNKDSLKSGTIPALYHTLQTARVIFFRRESEFLYVTVPMNCALIMGVEQTTFQYSGMRLICYYHYRNFSYFFYFNFLGGPEYKMCCPLEGVSGGLLSFDVVAIVAGWPVECSSPVA